MSFCLLCVCLYATLTILICQYLKLLVTFNIATCDICVQSLFFEQKARAVFLQRALSMIMGGGASCLWTVREPARYSVPQGRTDFSSSSHEEVYIKRGCSLAVVILYRTHMSKVCRNFERSVNTAGSTRFGNFRIKRKKNRCFCICSFLLN